MVSWCATPACASKDNLESRQRGITFHKFPKEKKLRRKWEVALRRKGFVATNNHVCCSEHFKPEDFDRTGQTVRLREGTIPSVFSYLAPRKAVKPRTTQTSRKAEESHLSVEGPQHSQQTRPSGFVATISKTAASIKAPQHSQQTRPSGFLTAISIIKDTAEDHSYVLPGSLNGLKAKLEESKLRESKLRDSLQRMTLELKRVQARERRAKKKISCLLEDLQANNLLNEELKARLDYFSDVPMALLAKQGQEYTKDQREFALTLHQHGPKAYEYLRRTLHLNLPHPHTLQRWNLRTKTSNNSDLDCVNGTESEGLEGSCLENPAWNVSVEV